MPRATRRRALLLTVMMLSLPLAVACDGWMPDSSASPAPAVKDEAAAGQGGATSAEQRLAELRSKYERKAEATPEDPGNPTVRCQTGGEIVFMRRYDCVSRNGRPL